MVAQWVDNLVVASAVCLDDMQVFLLGCFEVDAMGGYSVDQ